MPDYRLNIIITTIFLCGVLTGWPLQITQAAEPVADSVSAETISRIACGSCSKQSQPQPIWNSVIASHPELFIYMGDNIYGDTEDMNLLASRWSEQKNQEGYRKLRESCRILGTWDDHDYGKNDAGREYPQKVASQQLFLDFLDEPQSSLRRKREGVYWSHLFGPEGQRIQIILLDTRYFRSPLKAVHDRSPKAEGHSGPYGPTDDPDAVMLGEAQWTWLEQQLKVPAEIRLIVSSIQVLPVQHRWEKWENLPGERERLLNLISRTNANGVIFLSGDRHAAEFSKLKRDNSYTLWELTSSSLNSPRKLENEINDYRHGILYNDENFGMMEVDWTQDDPPITLSIRDLQGTPIMQVATRLSAIQP